MNIEISKNKINEIKGIINKMENIKNIDNSWIDKFENLEQDYKKFYKEECESVNIIAIYCDKDNNIYKVDIEKEILNEGTIKEDRLMEIITEKSKYGNQKHRLGTILKYNINLEEDELKVFLTTDTNDTDDNYFKEIRKLTDIKFEDTISLLNDLNALIIILKAKSKIPISITRKNKK